jgi:hypothetical protein
MSKKPIVYGSIKRKIVASDLLAERENCNLDQKEMKKLMFQDEET